MKRFARLFAEIDGTTRTLVKVAALAGYFREAPEADRLWTVALFSGRRPRRAVTATRLREWAAERAGLPLWLVEEAYPVVGDLAETVALILPPPETDEDESLSHWIVVLRDIAKAPEEEKKSTVLAAWAAMDTPRRFLFNKLITGGFRVGVSQKLMTRALAQATGIDEAELTHRLMGEWTPDTVSWHDLIEAEDPGIAESRPYPFCLAHALDDTPESLGDPAEWRAEWKWDGIRGQLILRADSWHLWSRGEDLISDAFPEFARAADFLPQGTVIDGEVLAWEDGGPMPFAALQKRLGRRVVPKSVLKQAPAMLYAYDLLEWQGEDIRARPFAERRSILDSLLADLSRDAPIRPSPLLPFTDWTALAETRSAARDRRAEGLMLKRADSPYHAGRKRGDWWKWKLDPFTIDAVMIYAQAGSGRRAALYTDFTFAVWDGNALVPFTKAYSGLSDEEFREITRWVGRNTQQRFGPVRQVTPEHVFEIAFGGIQASARHKSGVALRFPRMARWRKDKPIQEANTLDDLKAMLAAYG